MNRLPERSRSSLNSSARRTAGSKGAVTTGKTTESARVAFPTRAARPAGPMARTTLDDAALAWPVRTTRRQINSTAWRSRSRRRSATEIWQVRRLGNGRYSWPHGLLGTSGSFHAEISLLSTLRSSQLRKLARCRNCCHLLGYCASCGGRMYALLLHFASRTKESP